MRPENTSAIVALREAATMPLQLMKNRWHAFVEENARIWLEFWISFYGKRALKVKEKEEEWYFPFDAAACKDLIINTRIDVGPASLWSEITSLQTLDNLLKAGIIDPLQYISRLPKGSVPELSNLIRELKERAQAVPAEGEGHGNGTAGEVAGGTADPASILGKMSPEHREKFNQLPPEQQAQIMKQLQANA
jgi:hypothetical protein